MISQSTIDKVFEAARVEEVIEDFVQLRKSGSGFKALSPFTDEKTPSFSVSPAKQIWKDFSSGKGGNVVAFLMEHEHFSYPEAIRYLAKRYGIEIEETERSDEEKEKMREKENLYVVSEYAADFFEEVLWKDEMGRAVGLAYFRERGFKDSTIRDFRLGYSPEQRDAFSGNALEKGYSPENLVKAGLSMETGPEGGNTRLIDRFRGRVVFPIFSMSGRVLGFGGRILSQQKKVAKYINSPESEIYHKSHVLYGLFQAKQEIARLDNCYLVEGYTDVIQLHQLGIRNVVASSGTALTSEQVGLIRRLTENVTLLFDGDAAGLRAAERGVDLILEQNMNAFVCTFPEGEDPDSFARKHSLEKVRGFLEEHSNDFIFFKAKQGSEEFAHHPMKRAETARELVKSIARVPDMIKREVYLRQTARLLEVSEEALFSELTQIDTDKLRREKQQNRRKEASQTLRPVTDDTRERPAVNKQEILERKILELLVNYGERVEDFEEWVHSPNAEGEWELKQIGVKKPVYLKVFLDLQEDEIAFANPLFRELYEWLMRQFQQYGSLDVPRMQAGMEVHLANELAAIAMEEERYKLNDWERKEIYPGDRDKRVSQLVTETLLSLRITLLKGRIRELQESLNAEGGSQPETLLEISDYLNLNKLIHQRLNRVLSS